MVENYDNYDITSRTEEIFSFMGIAEDNSGKGVVCPLCGSGTGNTEQE